MKNMKRFTNMRLLLLLLSSSFFSPSTAADSLTTLKPLIDGETLVSARGKFVLGFFSPAGSKNRYVGIWYSKVSAFTVVWVANRRNPITSRTGILTLTNNGSLVISAQNSTAVWSSSASGIQNPVAQILDSGNFVVREVNNIDSESFGWQSFDHPTDTQLPGMKLGWNLATGLNRNITSWTSATDPSPGRYTMVLDVQGDPQEVLIDGSRRVWRSGPWVGGHFTGTPEMKSLKNTLEYNFVDNQKEVYYVFNIMNDSFLSLVKVDSNGTAQRTVWINETGLWNVFCYAPKDQCDYISTCGPYGVCNPNKAPICDCLPGFQPKSPASWAMSDGRDGCVRKTALDCRAGTDGFVTVSNSKLPDTTSATVEMNVSLAECKAKCFSNCSCKAYASADVRNGGSGCITWTTDLTDLKEYVNEGQELYVRLASSDLGITSNKPNIKKKVITIAMPIILCVLIFPMIYLTLTKRKRQKGTIDFPNDQQHDNDSEVHPELPLFDMNTIAIATDNFSEDNKLGEGGFGPVYMGKLKGGEVIAVKRLAKSSTQGVDEFKNEATLIARLQHRNLVRLLGYCIEGEERMLIYEYMPNKSLDAILFDKSKGAILDWQARYRIITGIARGLLYLHQDSRLKIIHRDLKASNVLLDKELNPKISDFGMARIFKTDETEANTKKVVGTYGYMSPEYAMDGIFSMKSDVYSFGVLILEIISGKKNRGSHLSMPHESLLLHAWSLWHEGEALKLFDHSVDQPFSLDELLRCITIGLLCVQELPNDRPTMSSIVLMLGSDDMLLPQPKRPVFVARRDFFKMKVTSSTSKQDACSINDVTISTLDGR